MKKKISLIILALIIGTNLILVYLIGKTIGPVIWIISVFIVAPAAAILLIPQVIIFLVRLFKRKKVVYNFLFIVITLLFIYPGTILTGHSNICYPRNATISVDIINPVAGSVMKGGKKYKSHRAWPSEAYAYDIVKEPYEIKSDRCEDYIYLVDVVSPVSGTIIDLYQDEDDITPNTENFKSDLGNYIFIKKDETSTYMILAHLEKNSIFLQIGDHVVRGEFLAKVGNSGTTSEPHLHLQHQYQNPMKMKYLYMAYGLPMNIINEAA